MFNSFLVQLLIDSSSLTKIESCHSLPYTFAPTLKRAMAFIIKLYFSLINLLLDENVFFHVQSNNELNIQNIVLLVSYDKALCHKPTLSWNCFSIHYYQTDHSYRCE